MKNENILDTMVFEHQVWLQILVDHARFIFYSLAPTEEEAILMAKQFMDAYDMLLDKVRGDIKTADLDEITEQAFEVTYEDWVYTNTFGFGENPKCNSINPILFL